MKLNRKWIMVLALVMSMAMATTGTLAYLTDRDSEANVFTMGNVDIDLEEEFDPEDAELIPGEEIEKMPTITNTGKTDAWVWMIWSIPAELDNKDAELGTDNYVHYNYYGGTAEDYYKQEKYYNSLKSALTAKGIEVPEHQEMIDNNMYWSIDEFIGTKTDENGIVYNCYAYKYHKALAPGETTLPSIHTVYLDDHIDIDPKGNLHYVNAGVVTDINWNINTQGAPVIYVNAYAMQKDGFTDVDAAFDAYTNQWTSTGKSIDGIEFAEADDVIDKPAVLVSTEEELVAALAEGGEVVLATDIVVTEPVAVAEDVTVALDLNGNTLSGSIHKNDGHIIDNAGDLTVTGGTVKSTAENGGSAIRNTGKLSVSGATLVGAPQAGESWPSYVVNNFGEMTLENTTVEAVAHGAISSGNGATTTLNNVNALTHGFGGSSHVLYVYGSETSVVVNGGTYDHKGNVDGSVCYISAGNVVINDGTFTYANGGYGIAVMGTLTINGGSVGTVIDWGGTIIDNR